MQKGQQEPRSWKEGAQRSSCLYMVSAGSFPGPQVTPISGRISVICPEASSSIPGESLEILESPELGRVFTVSWTYLKGRRNPSKINLCNTNYNFKIHLPPLFKIMESSSLWRFLEQLQEWGLPRHLGCDMIYSSAHWPPHPHPQTKSWRWQSRILTLPATENLKCWRPCVSYISFPNCPSGRTSLRSVCDESSTCADGGVHRPSFK